jgi:N-acetylneuraminate synthase
MKTPISIGTKNIGDGEPVYIIAEIGINHNGDIDLARQLIDAAAMAGCDAVKFQKRTPELCVPPEQQAIPRETPWGLITYLDYRHRIEFGDDEYQEIDRYCRTKKIDWFASCWDIPSVDFIEEFDPVCHKVASATLTDDALLDRIRRTGRPVILSTGMSTIDEIDHAVSLLEGTDLLIAHSTSSYPCKNEELNLRMIHTLRERYGVPVGYSGHEVGLQTTVAAAAIGACFVERHITLDRAMWGTDQAASVEVGGFVRLVRDIRIVEKAMGTGVKQVYESELPVLKKLRRNCR